MLFPDDTTYLIFQTISHCAEHVIYVKKDHFSVLVNVKWFVEPVAFLNI